jgi:hypothetical protein
MEEPPEADRRSQHHQPQRLIAPKEPQQLPAALLFSHLLVVGLDAVIDHSAILLPVSVNAGFMLSRISIGESHRPVFVPGLTSTPRFAQINFQA